MMLVDHWALLLIPSLPILGALFALLVSGEDRLTLRHVGMAVSIAAALVACRASFLGAARTIELDVGIVRLCLDPLRGPLLAVFSLLAPMALRSGAPRIHERTQFYVATFLFAQGLLALALVVEAPALRLAIAPIAAVPLFALVALFGGPERGSTTLRAAILWLFADLAALAALAWVAARAGLPLMTERGSVLADAVSRLPLQTQVWILCALLAPGLLRLGAGPFSVWLEGFLTEAPVGAAVLATAGAAPLGFVIVGVDAVLICPAAVPVIAPWCLLVGGAACGIAGIVAVAERDLRTLLSHALQSAGVLCALGALLLDARALAAAALHTATTGAAAALVLMTTEATERRFESRDTVDLTGMSAAAPLIAALLVAGFCGFVGIPGCGQGTSLWELLRALAISPLCATGPLGKSGGLLLAVLIAFSTLLLAAGVAQVARRLLSPAPRKAPRVSRQMTALQSLRLMLPAATALGVGLVAGTLLVTAQEAARLPVAHAVTSAGLVVQPVVPFAVPLVVPAAVEVEPTDPSSGVPP